MAAPEKSDEREDVGCTFYLLLAVFIYIVVSILLS